jgi:hypothetical protein
MVVVATILEVLTQLTSFAQLFQVLLSILRLVGLPV